MNTTWSAIDGPWRGDGIAIVGMAGRFPGAVDVGQLWEKLCQGVDCIARFSEDELRRNGVDEATLRHERFVPAGAVLDGIELFDAEFFNISPREAESMDPQQRLFLEVVQEALDDAALDPEQAPGAIGLYAGCRFSEYWRQLLANPQFMGTMGWHQVASGNDKDFLATQASFRFNLRGPSVSVQTACSTSLVAVSLACDALIAGHCDIAVAGGASVAVPHRTGYVYQPSGIASPDGRCRPFDAGANGSVLGNAVAAVVLKRINRAFLDRDRIYAVLRAAAVNNDGHSKSSFAAPSVAGQAEVIARAMRNAGVAPAAIQYVEAHGTATALGDPIEVTALARAFEGPSGRREPCGLGSIKGNVGHLDPAAGVTSLIKVALSLHHRVLPPSINFVRPNPAIDFDAANFRVVVAREPWLRDGTPRRAGVSAFGIGGTNVHVVLEEGPAVGPSSDAPEPELLLLSARSGDALSQSAEALAARLDNAPDLPLGDVAFSLARRRHFRDRVFVVAASTGEAAERLRNAGIGARRVSTDHEVCFLFPGQGTQYPGMGRVLMQHEPALEAAFAEVAEIASDYLDFDLTGLFVGEDAPEQDEIRVQQTVVAQPLLFAFEYALARVWMHGGIRPHRVLGHSVGELVAACIAGVMSLHDAVHVVCIRGRAMQRMKPGAMIAVTLDEAAARELEDDDIRLSASNAPLQQTLAGSIEAIRSLHDRLAKRGVPSTVLRTSHAFHHPSMKEAADELLQTLKTIPLNEPTIPLGANATGRWMTREQAKDPAYWAAGITAPVRFSGSVEELLSGRNPVLIECGPGGALGALVRAHEGSAGATIIASTAPRGSGKSDRVALLEALGTVWQSGVGINWGAVWQTRKTWSVSLPPYAFQRKRYWVDPPPRASRFEDQGGTAPAASPEPCITRSWNPVPLPPRRESDGASWLVLADTWGPAHALCDRLEQLGQRVFRVLPGAAYQRTADGVYTVAPGSVEAARLLADDVSASAGRLRVVNGWTMLPLTVPLDISRADLGVQLAFTAPAAIVQALARRGRPPASVDFITSRLFTLAPGEIADPTFAPAIGVARVLPQELPEVRARLVDVALPATPADAWAMLNQVAMELLTDAEPVVAYRGGLRLVETAAPLRLPPADSFARRLRPRGTYLITGGFGGIGGVLARLLAVVPGVQLALVGRRALGGQQEDAAPGARARQLVHELEEKGATVLPIAADITDPGEVDRVFRAVRERFGPVSGLIHAAGIPGGGFLLSRDLTAAEAVFAPKVRGTIALLAAVAPDRPDFVALCSSLASVMGGPGQADYAGANAFLDAVAWYGRAAGIPVTSIGWPAWREVGMAATMTLPSELESLKRNSLAAGIDPAQGTELFAAIMAADCAHAIVAAAQSLPPAVAPRLGTQPASPPLARNDRPPAAAPPPPLPTRVDGDLEAVLQDRLAGIWSEVLGITVTGGDANFFEFGGQSLMALQVVARLRELFPIELDLADVLQHPGLSAFTHLVQGRLEAAVANLPDERVRELLAAKH